MYDDWLQFLARKIDQRPVWDVLLRGIPDNPLLIMIEKDAGTIHRTIKSRLLRFCDYQQRAGEDWFEPQLTAYRDHLLDIEQKPYTTVGSYLSTVRCAYRKLASAE
jgi:hypothetical protein